MVSGAAYVPLDPAAAPSRSTAILEAADLDLVLFDGTAESRPPALAEVRALDVSDVPAPGAGRSRPLPDANAGAYVIFTSGSTGVPKGVVVEHASLINYASWCASLIGGSGGVPLFGNLGFDHSLTSLWPPLVRGTTVTLCAGVWDHDVLFGGREHPFELIKVTPSHLRFFERTGKPDYRASTRILMSGGEMLDSSTDVLADDDRAGGALRLPGVARVAGQRAVLRRHADRSRPRPRLRAVASARSGTRLAAGGAP